MDPLTSTIGGVVSAGLQTVGNILYGNYSYDKARADNLKQWQRENEYNTPKAQMDRLRAAGLNPRLVYGSGADVIARPAPAASPPHASIENPLGNISAFQQVENMDAQNKVIQADAELRKGQIAVTGQDVRGKKMELDALEDIQNTTGLKISPSTPDSIKEMAYIIYMMDKQGAKGLLYAAPGAVKAAGNIFKGIFGKLTFGGKGAGKIFGKAFKAAGTSTGRRFFR